MILSLLIAVCIAASPLAGARAPAWLTEIATRKAPAYDDEVNAVVLLRDRRITVEANGNVLTSERGAIRVLNHHGKSEAVVRVLYRTDTGKVRRLKAWTVYRSGTVKEYSKKDIVDVSLTGDAVYDESRVRAIIGSSFADPGSVFGYEWSAEDRSIFTQLSYLFQDDLPALTSRFTLLLPAGWTAKGVVFNHDELQPVQTGSTYLWQLDNLPPVLDEVARPPLTSLVPRVAVSYYPPAGASAGPTFRSWAEVAQWLASLRESQTRVNDRIRAKVKALTASAATELDRIRAIGGYVQELRYVSIQTGVGRGGGYRPHPATDVFQHAYGDCKDKANLMCTMLREAGIEAWPVTVFAGDPRYVRPGWPSPQQFNHVIVAIRLGQPVELPAVEPSEEFGRLLFFDPTDEFTPLGYLPRNLRGSSGLIVSEKTGGLITLPAAGPLTNCLRRTVQARMNATGDLEAEVREHCSGDSASHNRHLFRSLNEADYRKLIERWVTYGSSAASVSAIDVSDDGPDFQLSISYKAPRYARSMQGRLLMFRPTLLSRREGNDFREIKRKYPVALRDNSYVETPTIELPPGFTVDEMPPPLELSAEFGSYKAGVEIKNGQLVFTREMEVKSAIVPVTNYHLVSGFYQKIQNIENAPVVLLRK